MSFKTFTCVICGEEGLTKRTSKSWGDGRCCVEHSELQDAKLFREKAVRAAVLGYLSFDFFKSESGPVSLLNSVALEDVKFWCGMLFTELKNTSLSRLSCEVKEWQIPVDEKIKKVFEEEKEFIQKILALPNLNGHLAYRKVTDVTYCLLDAREEYVVEAGLKILKILEK